MLFRRRRPDHLRNFRAVRSITDLMRRRARELVDSRLQTRPAEDLAIFAEGGGANGGGEAAGVGREESVEEVGVEGDVGVAVQDPVDQWRGEVDLRFEV